MSWILDFYRQRRGRIVLAAVLLIVLQGLILLLPGMASARPLLTAAGALPSVVILIPPSRLTNPFNGFSFHRDNVLGTSLDLYVAADSKEVAERCERIVLNEIERLEKILSTRDPESEISRRSNGSLTTPSPELNEILGLCESWRDRTDGSFDARLGALIQVWKQAERQNRLPSEATLQQLVGRLDEQPWNVDALGKSYILDRAARLAREQLGVRGLLIDVGGDILALGHGNGINGIGWEIGVAHPDRPHDNATPMTRLPLLDQAVATSAAYERPMTIQGSRYSHILNPRTGRPATGIASATVVAPDAASANALATALCNLTPPDGLRLVERTAGASCLIVAADASEYRSAGLVERLITADALADKWPENHQLTIELKLITPTTGRKIRRPYVAVWIEDADGKPVRTITVWGNQPKYLRDLSDWWKWASKDNDLVKAVTKASRAPGSYSLVWDGLDDKGKALPAGTYTVQLEVHREHGKHVRQTGKVECGTEKATLSLDATSETGETKIEYGPREK